MPTISVIVPVYKVEKYIHRCVDSILGQTFTDFELILVDDGSPDGSPVICDEYAAKDSRVVVIHQENGGLSAARNAGSDWAFANSDSQWLTFIDSDDWVHPEYLELLLKAAEDSDLPISVCGFARTDGEMTHIEPEELAPVYLDTEDFYINNNVNATIAWGKLYKKELFKSIRYPVGMLHEDEFVTYKILFRYESVVVIPGALYAYFQHANSIMGSTWTPRRLDVLKAHIQQIQYFKSRRQQRLFESALNAYLNRQVLVKKQLVGLHNPFVAIYYRTKCKCQAICVFLRYHKALSIKKYPWAYEAIFPMVAKTYWMLCIIKCKISRRA